MSQNIQSHGFTGRVRAPAPTRRYANEQVSLGVYILQGMAGMAFMMFLFWLAGFGS